MPRVLVLSDCTVFGLGFEALAADDAAIEMLGQAREEDALATIEKRRPDVVVVDFGTTKGPAVGLCEALGKRWPGLPVLVLSSTLDDEAVRVVIEAGARGYLHKNADREQLRSAIGWLADGQAVLDPLVTGRVIDWASHGGVEVASDTLSEKETEVLRLVSRGEPNKLIAKAMGVTENTVKTYLRRAYRKLGCHTRSAAAAAVAQRGLL